MTHTDVEEGRIAGWCYSQSGTPVAYVIDCNNPSDATHIPCDTWWQALRFALSFSETNRCEYVGGPGYDER